MNRFTVTKFGVHCNYRYNYGITQDYAETEDVRGNYKQRQEDIVVSLVKGELDFRSYIELITKVSNTYKKDQKFIQRVKNILFKYNKRFNMILNGCIMKYFRECNDSQEKFLDFLTFVGRYNCSNANKKILIRSIFEQSSVFFRFERFKYVFDLPYKDSLELHSDFNKNIYQDVEKYNIPVLCDIVSEYLYE
jgi:hypothetical protein